MEGRQIGKFVERPRARGRIGSRQAWGLEWQFPHANERYRFVHTDENLMGAQGQICKLPAD